MKITQLQDKHIKGLQCNGAVIIIVDVFVALSNKKYHGTMTSRPRHQEEFQGATSHAASREGMH